jgi:hypothetical protein
VGSRVPKVYWFSAFSRDSIFFLIYGKRDLVEKYHPTTILIGSPHIEILYSTQAKDGERECLSRVDTRCRKTIGRYKDI